MNPNTGDLHKITEKEKNYFEKMNRQKLVELTDEQVKTLEPLSKPQRKNKMRNHSCPCGSGVKFKRCCWNKYV